MKRNLIRFALLLSTGVGAFAQNMAAGNAVAVNAEPATTASTVQRDVYKAQGIEHGLQNGALTSREAAFLERDQSLIDRLQTKALNDGKLSSAERWQLAAAQNRASRDIKAAESNCVNGNPPSASSWRMQASVQRNLNQGRRVDAGIQNAGRLADPTSGVQARVEYQESLAGRDGYVNPAEQAQMQRAKNLQSRKIPHEKHEVQDHKS